MNFPDRSSLDSGYDEASADTVRYVGQADLFPADMSRSSCGDTVDYAENAKVVQLDMEGLYLVSMTRSPSALRLGLTEGPYMRACRERLVAQGHEYELATGAKIFCEPDQYAATRVAVKHLEGTFRPYHVVATEKHLPSVLYTVRSFPHSLKVKVKSSRLIAYIGRSQEKSQQPERGRTGPARKAGRFGGSAASDVDPSSCSMPLFVQLASKGNDNEDYQDAWMDHHQSTMPPAPDFSASDFQQSHVDPPHKGLSYGMRSTRTAPLR